ncbi:MAG TPA: VacJ family lipoprotein [Burkholderiales bacterium]|nr:VacJ family lipoprotein [Burkholderiales bacterium]
MRTALLCLLLVSGCATVEGERDPRDPWEGFNRGVYRFNETFDEYIAQPVARGYVAVLHQEIRTRVSNFFSNIQDLLIGANNFLQGKFEDGVNDWARFAFNSTIGLFGIHDVASDFPGLEKHNEDFGQTLGRWGAGPGPYLILPFLGSSTVRDAAGTAVDWAVQPVGEVRPIELRNTLYGLYFVDTRAQLLEASRILEEAALDKYTFQRDAYLQRRRSLIYDGRPPREKIE